MKKLLVVGMIIGVLAICSLANASGIGETIEPLGNGKVSVSVVNNRIYDKDYESSDDAKIYIDKMNQTYAKIAVGVGENFNFYTILGETNSAEFIEDYNNFKIKYESEPDFLWGFGINNTYKLENNYFIGSDFHFLKWKADIDKIDLIVGSETYNLSSWITGEYEYYEYQGTMFIGKRFDYEPTAEMPQISYIPYLGIFYNYSKIEDVTFTIAEIGEYSGGSTKNDDKFGIMLGANMEIAKSFLLNIEGRFIAEKAFTIGGTYKF